MKLLRPFNLLFVLFVVTSLMAQKRVLIVEKISGEGLLETLDKANTLNADSVSERLFVLIPNGFYDLGETALTPILGHNIALIGESMEGTIIRNAPPVEKEGISTTAVLLNRGHNTYVQDLTLQNDLDYYHSGPAGRAVCWQDKGFHAMFKRVRMLSYQDTFYSHSENCEHYFEDSEIHGTVDFICGAGDVYFNRCTIVTEKRSLDGSGYNVIAAPRTSITDWGFVFSHCTIRSYESQFGFARAWHTRPRCAWLYTRVESPELLMPTHYDPEGLRTTDVVFSEYGTTDAQGLRLAPVSDIIEFRAKEERARHKTTISKREASRFTVKNVFGDWQPDKKVKQIEKEAAKLKKQYFNQKQEM